MKPLPFAVWAALRREGATPEEAVLVGDQLYTDMAAGNLAGVRTILVRPQSTRDLWYTLILRRFERLVLGDRHFEGEGRPDRR
jgi:predicted HAD superfamily phosphohydrolase YqeG